jgi:hypothetical protein
MIPEPLTSLKIRWFALRIRKRSNREEFKERARKLLNDHVPLPRIEENPFNLPWNHVPALPGLYWLRGQYRNFYVGETFNLHERLRIQFSPNRFDYWGAKKRELQIGYSSVNDRRILIPNQSIWIGKWKPEGNLANLAAAS